MKKKVLISYASLNSISKKLAYQIENNLDKTTYDVRLIDIKEYFNIFNNNLINRLNINIFKYIIKQLSNKEIINIINTYNPDIIICTHIYSSHLISYLKENNYINTKLLSIVSDFTSSNLWSKYNSNIDAYVVSNHIIKNELIRKGINPNNIFTYGIPTYNINYINNSKDYIIKTYSLNKDKPIYLVLGDSYNFEYFKYITKCNSNIDIIYITSKDLIERCNTYIYKNNIDNILVLSKPKDIYNLMNISNVIISKPGSTSINDIIYMNKPCILLKGQNNIEISNRKYMLKHHLALKANTPLGLKRKINLTIKYPFLINSVKNKLLKYKKDNSINKINNLIDTLLNKKDV